MKLGGKQSKLNEFTIFVLFFSYLVKNALDYLQYSSFQKQWQSVVVNKILIERKII